MIILSIVLAAFVASVIYWNSILEEYSLKSAVWLQGVAKHFKDDPDWEPELERIRSESLTLAYTTELDAKGRRVPYYTTLACALASALLTSADMYIGIVQSVLICGAAYVAVSGLHSRNQYYKLKWENDAVLVVVTAKIGYDSEIAKENLEDE